MTPRLQRIEDTRPAYASVYAILHGPLLLAGLTTTASFGMRNDPHKLDEWLSVHPGLKFRASQSGGADWTLRPLNRIVDESYTAYFNITLDVNASAEICDLAPPPAEGRAHEVNNPHSVVAMV